MRLEELRRCYAETLEEFGSPERNMAERRRMLRQLRDMEKEMDKYYGLNMD